VPNIKYYYAFRFLNNHNVPSNISDVFEVEMKDEDGYKYLNVSKYEVNYTAKKTYNKALKRYLLIRPSMIQTFPSIPENATSVDDIVLGPEKQAVWDKNFILRITSKRTNRVLEFLLKSKFSREK